jgi:phage/plasmid-associated DNA primase
VPIRINEVGLLEFFRNDSGMVFSPITGRSSPASAISHSRAAVREAKVRWCRPISKEPSNSVEGLAKKINAHDNRVRDWVSSRFVLASSDFTLAKKGTTGESVYVVEGDHAYRPASNLFEAKEFAIGVAKGEAYLEIPPEESRKALVASLRSEEDQIEELLQLYTGKTAKAKAKTLFDTFFTMYSENDICRAAVLPVWNKANDNIKEALAPVHAANVFGIYVIEEIDLAEEPTPAWNEALSRIEPEYMRKVFLATVWSALEPRIATRTIVWITGPGGCGKSALTSAISSWFPEIAKEFPHGTEADKHTAYQLEGKSIITVGDCKNPRLHENQAIRNYSGNDSTVADPKGEKAYDIKIGFGNVFVNSNLMPEVDVHDEATATRVFPCKMKQVGKNVVKISAYVEKLKKEKKGFLFQCRKAFSEIYLTAGKNEVLFSPTRPESYIEWVKDNCGKEIARISNYIVRNYTKDKVGGKGTDKQTVHKAVLKDIGITSSPALEKDLQEMSTADRGMRRSGTRLNAILTGIELLWGGEFKHELTTYPIVKNVIVESYEEDIEELNEYDL